ncbi:uncharacterized protein BHQ10_009569 [Talaromyces amestolkiae]|uniref:Uncharacterized protein n=1 Tax=Talaromyces amestolkiae TaxID=1196081 RepID=A0A364LCP4_TALAM|nr:uncharacterized protein BHQ10_009569 [Talaromyces amestolkiae]RAO73557.1 hypothetical protein BHQ10_009569 [Talaromyces amestolkiae]
MEKVWFKLRQTDYPPPPEKSILAGNGDDSSAPICLGHFIPDLKSIDFPINPGAILAFPPRMKVYHTHALDFKWDDSKNSETGTNWSGGVPIAPAAGLTFKGSLKLTFKKTLKNHEAYDRLDSYIVNPNRRYVEECLEQKELKKYLGDKKMWSMFMITGLKVARVGTREAEKSKYVESEAGPEVDFPTVATVTATANVVLENLQKTEGTYVSEFIWAVRLAKVHKGLLMTDWSIEPYTTKATFTTDNPGVVNVAGVLEAEGLEKFHVVNDEELNEAFVVGSGDWDAS